MDFFRTRTSYQEIPRNNQKAHSIQLTCTRVHPSIHSLSFLFFPFPRPFCWCCLSFLVAHWTLHLRLCVSTFFFSVCFFCWQQLSLYIHSSSKHGEAYQQSFLPVAKAQVPKSRRLNFLAPFVYKNWHAKKRWAEKWVLSSVQGMRANNFSSVYSHQHNAT